MVENKVKLPAHMIPTARAPREYVLRLRKLERKIERIMSRARLEMQAVEQQANGEVAAVRADIDQVMGEFRERYNRSPEEGIHTGTRAVVIVFQEGVQLNDLPELPELEEDDDWVTEHGATDGLKAVEE
uniref:Uncharacterized protein n=1 Tax=viral metagenome TaxID=1070528 RepID=A0A6M3M7X8_9ZZZZ